MVGEERRARVVWTVLSLTQRASGPQPGSSWCQWLLRRVAVDSRVRGVGVLLGLRRSETKVKLMAERKDRLRRGCK